MMNWNLNPAIAMVALLTLLSGCGDDAPPVNPEAGAMCPASPCMAEGSSCDGDTLVSCTVDAMGCLVEARTDCAATGGSCDGSGETPICLGDPCAGLMNTCDTAGSTCEGDTLRVCAPNADGCLVEEAMDCTAMPGGFCDPDMQACDADICRTLENRCDAASRACDGDNLVVCEVNEMGCLVESSTDCTATEGERCRSVEENPVCVDPCTLVTTCPAASYCDGADRVTCAADADGCVVETERNTCALGSVCDASTEMLECVDRTCPDADPTILTCDTTMGGMMPLMAETVAGMDPHDRYTCESYSYFSPERIFRFQDPMNAEVEISVSWADRSNDMDLIVTSAGDGTAACDDMAACVDSSAGTTTTETVNFAATTGSAYYVTVDRFSSSGSETTVPFTLTINCTRPVCGDGIVGAGETCDDGNTMVGDGCDAACGLEMGYVCYEPGMPCEVACGNGRVDTDLGETCDDMGTAAGDGCAADCTLEMGYACYGEPSRCEIACGNGRVDTDLGETCDDMGTMDGDGCAADCTTEMGFGCSGEPSVCTPLTPIAAAGSTVSLMGTISSTDPTFTRPSPSCTLASWASGDYYHDVHAIVNETGAEQRVQVTAMWMGDGYLFAYSDPFVASDPAMNCLAGSDDFGGTSGSRVTITMAPGAVVQLVPTTFSRTSSIGDYTIEVATLAPAS